MSFVSVSSTAASAAIASAVTASSRVLYFGIERQNALTRCRSIRVASGRDFFTDASDLRLFGADAEPGIVRTVAARVVAEQVVVVDLVIVEHTAFAGLSEVDFAVLFPGAGVLRIAA